MKYHWICFWMLKYNLILWKWEGLRLLRCTVVFSLSWVFNLFTVKMTVFNGYEENTSLFQIYLRLRKTSQNADNPSILYFERLFFAQRILYSFVHSWAVKMSLSLILLVSFWTHYFKRDATRNTQMHAHCVCFKGQIQDSPRSCHSGIVIVLCLHLPLCFMPPLFFLLPFAVSGVKSEAQHN